MATGFKSVDMFGGLGGFTTGFFLGMAMMPAVRQRSFFTGSFELKVKKVGMILTFAWFVLILSLLFYSTPVQYTLL